MITLTRAGDRVNAVSIESNRPVHACSVLAGKPVANVQKMMPLLFSICASAQSCAAVRALEQAQGLTVAAPAQLLRDRLVGMETLREHLWRILLDWPTYTGEEPRRDAMARVVALQRESVEALCLGGNAFALGGLDCAGDQEALLQIGTRLLDLLRDEVFGEPVDEWMAMAGYHGVRDWAARHTTPAARLVDLVRCEGWHDAGACDIPALPDLADQEVDEAMRDYAFAERPQWLGECRETSCLTRVDGALLHDLKQRFGNGLLTRLAARLQEVAVLASCVAPAGVIAEPFDRRRPEGGIGQAVAARGQLVHRVILNDSEQVADYRILAPTEWNFHPQGVVSRSLAALQGGSAEQIERLADLLITAIDPCVGYELRLVDGG